MKDRQKFSDELLESPCSECGGTVKWGITNQEYEREGLSVQVSGIRALVCGQCGESYFTPEGTQHLVALVNDLYALAHANGQQTGRLTATLTDSSYSAVAPEVEAVAPTPDGDRAQRKKAELVSV